MEGSGREESSGESLLRGLCYSPDAPTPTLDNNPLHPVKLTALVTSMLSTDSSGGSRSEGGEHGARQPWVSTFQPGGLSFFTDTWVPPL